MLSTGLDAGIRYQPQSWITIGAARLPARFGDLQDEYKAVQESIAIVDRGDRGLLKIGGEDRAAWLHNLVTNAVTTLDVHRGNYAFAVDVRGRVLFDMNLLIMPDEIWLDIPRAALGLAGDHFDKHLFAEDVTITNASDDYLRLGVCGQYAAGCMQQRGAGQLMAMPDLGLASFGGDATLFRHDFAGVPGFELIVEREEAVGIWNTLVEEDRAIPVGFETIDLLRIEAGIPWYGRDIDETVLPPETLQIERGINYHKGCYLGQEIIERMRAYNSLGNSLVRVKIEDGEGLKEQDAFTQEGKAVGRLTSLRQHPVSGDWLGLGYLKTKAAAVGTQIGDPARDVEILS